MVDAVSAQQPLKPFTNSYVHNKKMVNMLQATKKDGVVTLNGDKTVFVRCRLMIF